MALDDVDRSAEKEVFGGGSYVEGSTDFAVVRTGSANGFRANPNHPGLAQIQWQLRLMSLSQMQIGCLPGSQMGFTSMHREPVGAGSVVEPCAVPTNIAVVASSALPQLPCASQPSREQTERSLTPWAVATRASPRVSAVGPMLGLLC